MPVFVRQTRNEPERSNLMQSQFITKLERKYVNLVLAINLLRLQKGKKVEPAREKRANDRRVRKLMQAAYEIPFYRKRFDQIGLKPSDFQTAEDLYKFPVLTKDDLRRWMDEEEGKEQYKYYFHDTTSGSSGTPTRVYYSPREKAWNMANWIRVLIRGGYNPFTGLTASRQSRHSVTGTQKNFLQNFGILRRVLINQYAPEPEVIEQINSLKPDLLYMNKTELMRVALYASKHNVYVHHPKFMVPTGEMIDENSRKLFLQVFGPGLIDAYGCAELGSIMTKYPGMDYWRIQGDLFAVNVYDDEGKPADEGSVCITPLYKTDFPLINYMIGDKVRMGRVNGIRVMKGVLGRSNDFISHANGDLTTFFMIAPIIANNENIVQARLIEKSYDLLIVQAVAVDGLTEDDIKAVEEDVASQLNKALKQPMEIRFEWLDVIQPDENGKLRLIVNEMKQKTK